MKKRKLSLFLVFIMALFVVTSCANSSSKAKSKDENVTILLAAASSMEYSLNEVIKMFEVEYPMITVDVTYDSSGKLQTQIEEGLGADLFLPAGMKQMNALKDQELVDGDQVVELLENKVVLIVPKVGSSDVTGFSNILEAEAIVIGDPASVPAGQYAEVIFLNIGIYEEVLKKASLATNVTQVLNQVAEGSADAGIVYATDAATTDAVRVLEEAPEGSLDARVIYPIGLVSNSKNKEAAKVFIEYLQTKDGAEVFEEFGFSLVN